MGIFDMPAMIDYILAETRQEQLFYVGFSQGTTQFWVLMSLLPRYNDKIKLMSALAPVAYVGHIGGILRLLSFFANFFRVRDRTRATPKVRSHNKYACNLSRI